MVDWLSVSVVLLNIHPSIHPSIHTSIIYKQLTELFNFSLKSGEYPAEWKLAKVSPLFKAGERNDPNNYRPISILSTISGVFEKPVYEQIYNYLIKTNLLDSR